MSTISGGITAVGSISGDVTANGSMTGSLLHSDGRGGTMDYEKLRNLPSIEGVTLIGDLTFSKLNMERVTNSDLEEILT